VTDHQLTYRFLYLHLFNLFYWITANQPITSR